VGPPKLPSELHPGVDLVAFSYQYGLPERRRFLTWGFKRERIRCLHKILDACYGQASFLIIPIQEPGTMRLIFPIKDAWDTRPPKQQRLEECPSGRDSNRVPLVKSVGRGNCDVIGSDHSVEPA
jgi:hypothetical protein